MEKSRKVSLIVLMVALIGLITVGLWDYLKGGQLSSIMQYAHPNKSIGDLTKAAVRVMEFIDFTSAESAAGSLLLEEYRKKYPDQMYITAKYFSTTSTNSLLSAQFAECAAAQKKFFPFARALFRTQDEWKDKIGSNIYFWITAKTIDLDIKEMQRCVENPHLPNIVLADKTLGESYLVKTVPTYFVNDKRIVGVNALREQLEKILK